MTLGSLLGWTACLPWLRGFVVALVALTVLLGPLVAPALGARPPSSLPSPELSVAITANRTQGSAPLSVFFTTTVTGAPLSSVTFHWDFGDGSTVSGPGANNSSYEHVYSRVGNFTASVNVTYGSTWAVNSVPIVASASVPPPLHVTISATPLTNAPLTVYFTANASGGNGGYTYLWAFGAGPGSTGTGAELLYTYNATGSYLASVTVTDSGGASAAAHHWVNVSSSPSPNPSDTTPWYSGWTGFLPWAISIVAVLVAMLIYLRSRRTRDRSDPSPTAPASPSPPREAGGGVADQEGSGGPRSDLALETATEPAPAYALGPVSQPAPGPASGETASGSTGDLRVEIVPSPASEPGEAGSPGAALDRPAGSAHPLVTATPSSSPPEGPSLESPKPPAATDKERIGGPREAPQGKVQKETLRLSFRLVLHIAAQGALHPHEVAPVELTQSGMASSLGARQNTIATILKRLEVAGVLTSDVRHVRGAPRRMKVYRLTPRGEALARDIRSRKGGSHEKGTDRPSIRT